MKLNLCFDVSASAHSNESTDYELSSSTKRRLRPKICIDIDNLEIMSDKTGVSDRSVATIAPVVLEGAGIINESDTSQVINRNKVRCAQKRA